MISFTQFGKGEGQAANGPVCGGEGGFTLIEVLIAIVILAMMSVLIYTSLSQLLKIKEETETEDTRNHSVMLVLGKMTRDFEMAFLLTNVDFLGTSGKLKTAFVGTEEKVDFNTLSLTRYFKEVKENDFGEVGYFLKEDRERGGEKILLRRESKNMDDKPEEGGDPETLLEGVLELHLSYYDAKKKEWFKSWNSTQIEFNNQLPRMVKIEIKMKDPESEDPLVYSTLANVKFYAQPIQF